MVVQGNLERNCTPARNKMTPRGRPFQSAYHGWSVPTKKRGYFEVNLSLSLSLLIVISRGQHFCPLRPPSPPPTLPLDISVLSGLTHADLLSFLPLPLSTITLGIITACLDNQHLESAQR